MNEKFPAPQPQPETQPQPVEAGAPKNVEHEVGPGVYAVYDGTTGELIDVGGSEEV
jgi:hypothetical protein